jgi:glycerophosphoryl diester phosphodiesterase
MKRIALVIATIVLLGALASPRGADPGPARSSHIHAIDAKTPRGLRELLGHTGDPLPIVSAHRGGAAKGFPENCIATFEHTLRHTFAMLEVDPRYTKDGAIVLHHDATLDRTTNGTGRVADMTLDELKKLRLKDPSGGLTPYSIPTLDEALQWARGKAILVLDQKDVPVAARVRKVQEHDAEAYTILIVYSFEDARACHRMNKDIVMEVMIPSREKAEQFDQTAVPWSNVVAFVGHAPPRVRELYDLIHARGANCMAGTSRNLDRRFINADVATIEALAGEYRALAGIGADLIETDLPRQVGPLLFGGQAIPASRAKYMRIVPAAEPQR